MGNFFASVRQKMNPEIGNGLSFEKVSVSANYLLKKTQHRPKIAIICGSGLAGLADLLSESDSFDFSDIPNFPVTTVPGHVSRILFGKLEGVTVMLMQGRFHSYEGHSVDVCAMPVRVMKLCGIQTLIVTNAAGGLNSDFKVGDIMIIKDHINLPGFSGFHPLRGPNDERFGSRFFSLNGCYDSRWRKLAKEIAMESRMSSRIHEGVYAMLGGPNFETIAELKMLKICGVDAVGMSTIPEVLVAHHCKINVFAFSLITNECILDENAENEPNHEEVLQAANDNQDEIRIFVSKMVVGMAQVETGLDAGNI